MKTFSHDRTQHRRAGMAQQQIIIGAAAVLAIGVCTVLLWNFFTGGTRGDDNKDFGFKCAQCGHEFIVAAQNLRTQTIDDQALKQHPERTANQAHCPQCQARHAGLAMRQCPECEKWFLLSKTNVRTDPDAETNRICPHCGLDLLDYARQRQ